MNSITKLLMLISTVVLVIGGGFSLYLSLQDNQPVAAINTGADGVAIDGFDVVAYYTSGNTSGGAHKGTHNFQVSWSGSLWYFRNMANQQAFSDDPEKYAPQYGGYDPFGMALNGTAQPATPELWAVVEGKLYLFHSGKSRKLWQENEPENRKNADHHWAKAIQQIRYRAEMK